MDAAHLITTARSRAGLSLRELAKRADTSHSAISAYEQRRTSPSVDTLNRILTAAGFAVDVSLAPRIGRDAVDRTARGRELLDALELAAMFPARHDAALAFPPFGQSPNSTPLHSQHSALRQRPSPTG